MALNIAMCCLVTSLIGVLYICLVNCFDDAVDCWPLPSNEPPLEVVRVLRRNNEGIFAGKYMLKFYYTHESRSKDI